MVRPARTAAIVTWAYAAAFGLRRQVGRQRLPDRCWQGNLSGLAPLRWREHEAVAARDLHLASDVDHATQEVHIVGGEGDRWVGGIQRQAWATILSRFVSQDLVAFVVKESSAELAAMNDLVADGKVTPVLGATYPLDDGKAAVADFEAGGVRGRIVITP